MYERVNQYQDVTMTESVDQYLFGIGRHFEVIKGLAPIWRKRMEWRAYVFLSGLRQRDPSVS